MPKQIKVYNELELKVEYLLLKEEYRGLNDISKNKYTFNEFLDRCYQIIDEQEESRLVQLFDAHYIDYIPFGHWCIDCGNKIEIEGEEFCNKCLGKMEHAFDGTILAETRIDEDGEI